MPDLFESDGRGASNEGAPAGERMKAHDLIDFFDRTFVLNLPERRDRRRDMELELRRLGFHDRPHKLEFFPARRVAELAGFPSPGARGCFLSHLEVLRRAQQSGFSRVLVMEDDLAISPHLLIVQRRLIARLARDDWDFAYLGHSQPKLSEDAGLFVPYDGRLSMAHFYAVRGRVIGQLVSFLEELMTRPAGDPRGGPMHLDMAYQAFRDRQPEVRTLLAYPNLGTQRSTRSDIAADWWDRVPVLREAASSLRWLRRQSLTP